MPLRLLPLLLLPLLLLAVLLLDLPSRLSCTRISVLICLKCHHCKLRCQMTYVGYTVPLHGHVFIHGTDHIKVECIHLLRSCASVNGCLDRVSGFCLKVRTLCTVDRQYLRCTVYLLVRD